VSERENSNIGGARQGCAEAQPVRRSGQGCAAAASSTLWPGQSCVCDGEGEASARRQGQGYAGTPHLAPALDPSNPSVSRNTSYNGGATVIVAWEHEPVPSSGETTAPRGSASQVGIDRIKTPH